MCHTRAPLLNVSQSQNTSKQSFRMWYRGFSNWLQLYAMENQTKFESKVKKNIIKEK